METYTMSPDALKSLKFTTFKIVVLTIFVNKDKHTMRWRRVARR